MSTDRKPQFVFEKGAVRIFPEIDISGIRTKFLDVPYAQDSEYQKLDLYLPNEGEGPFPLIAYIHGGGFRRGDKRDIQIQGFMNFLEMGYAVASINWRLSFEAKFPAGVNDCREAIRFIKAHATQFQIDPDRIGTGGGSAGGYMALMMAAAAENWTWEAAPSAYPNQDPSVQCAVAWFPETNFATSFFQVKENEKLGIINISDNSRDPDDPEAPEALFLGGAINALDAAYLASASPVFYISEKMPPVLLQHGKADFTVPSQQSIEFCERARNAIGADKVELDLLDGAVHMDPAFETEENIARMERFLRKYLK